MSFYDYTTNAGDPIQVGDLKLVPFARSFTLRFPGWNGGIIWNRPVAVSVVFPDGQQEVLPVHDITRRFQIGLFLTVLLGGMLCLLIARKR